MSPDTMRTVNKIKENLSEITAKMKENRRGTPGSHTVVKHIPDESGLSEFAKDVARKVGSAANYLTRSDINTMSRDTIRLCRQYPTQSIATAMALGFLMGRMRRT